MRDNTRHRFLVKGTVRLLGAVIRGNVRIQSGTLGCVRLSYATIDGALQFSPASVAKQVDLSHARVGLLNDKYAIGRLVETTGWWKRWWQERQLEWFGKVTDDEPGRMRQYRLTGLTYDSLAPDMGHHPQELAQWLVLADRGEYHPQPYEQMVRALRAQGHEDAARHVAIAKRIARRREFMHHLYRALPTVPPGPLGSPGFRRHYECWKGFRDGKKQFVWCVKVVGAWLKQVGEYLLLDLPVRYGYRAWYALVHAAILCTFAAVTFHYAYANHAMVPVSTDILPVAVQEKEKKVSERLANERILAEQVPEPVQVLVRDAFSDAPNTGPFAVPVDREAHRKTIAATIHLDECVPEGYPQFNAAMFALDTFLPIIDLNQTAYWIPDRSKPEGRWYWQLQWGLFCGLVSLHSLCQCLHRAHQDGLSFRNTSAPSTRPLS